MHQAHEMQIDHIIKRLNELRGTELPNAKKKPDTPPLSPAETTPEQPGKKSTNTVQRSPETSETAKDNAIKTGDSSKTQHHTSLTESSDGIPSGGTTAPQNKNNQATVTAIPDHSTDSHPENVQNAPDGTPAQQEACAPVDNEKSTTESERQEMHSIPPPRENNPVELDSTPSPPENTTTTKPKQLNKAENAAALWHDLIEAVEKIPGKHQLKTYMQELRPVAYNQNCLQVAYDDEFPEEHVKLLRRKDNLQTLENALRRVTGTATARILIKRWLEGVSDETAKPRLVSSPEVRERVENNSFVRNVQQMFNAELIDVRG